jgi:hypothetical protein
LTDGVTRQELLGIGELDVNMPANVQVDVNAHTGAGATDIFGRVEGGGRRTRTASPAPVRPACCTSTCVGAGSVKVRRWTPDGSFIEMP